jgi:hypothetical protein
VKTNDKESIEEYSQSDTSAAKAKRLANNPIKKKRLAKQQEKLAE